MKRSWLLWLAVATALSLVVSYQVVTTAGDRAQWFVAQADAPTVTPGVDILDGVAVIPARIRGHDYHRSAFGDAWDDDNDAPGGHNGCDTRNDILNRDLVDKTTIAIKRCPDAVATGTLHDPYTNATVAFVRGNQIGASVQIDHIVPLALAWDLGARDWPDADTAPLRQRSGQPARRRRPGQPGQGRCRTRGVDAAEPRVLVSVRRAVQSRCCAATRLPIDQSSADTLRRAAATCPVG